MGDRKWLHVRVLAKRMHIHGGQCMSLGCKCYPTAANRDTQSWESLAYLVLGEVLNVQHAFLRVILGSPKAPAEMGSHCVLCAVLGTIGKKVAMQKPTADCYHPSAIHTRS